MAVVPVLVLAVCGYWYWLHPPSGIPSEAASTRVETTLHLDSFVLNLADRDQRSYLRVGIDLGLNHEPKSEESVPIAAVRDTILGVLADSKADELMTADGKIRLKQRLLDGLRAHVPGLGVEEIYFTEFLIQR